MYFREFSCPRFRDWKSKISPRKKISLDREWKFSKEGRNIIIKIWRLWFSARQWGRVDFIIFKLNYFNLKEFSITVEVQYCIQVYNIVIRHLYTLRSDHLNKSSTRLAPDIVITILLTIFEKGRFLTQRCNAHIWGGDEHKQACDKMRKCSLPSIFVGIPSVTATCVSCMPFQVSGTWEEGPNRFPGKDEWRVMGRWVWSCREAMMWSQQGQAEPLPQISGREGTPGARKCWQVGHIQRGAKVGLQMARMENNTIIIQ